MPKLLAAWVLAVAAVSAADLSASLHAQFPNADFRVVSVTSRQVLAESWEQSNVPIPVGSLVKPFLALAFSGPFPKFECQGEKNACWRPQPHGTLGFTAALAQSCNAYFLQLAAKVEQHNIEVVCNRFKISPPLSPSPQARIGLGDNWKVAPDALLDAYLELNASRGDPRVDQILTGLELAARTGTAREISRILRENETRRVPGNTADKRGRKVLAKTGTAPCSFIQGPLSPPSNGQRACDGDGFALALDPADAPQVALLVRVHNVPGAEAARTAARILERLQGR